jgi:hypothetical protein
MTFDVFQQQMDRLRGLRFAPTSLQTHWEALGDIPDLVLKAAITRAQRTRVNFPTPVDLRQDADVVAHLTRVLHDEDRGVDLEQPVELGTLPSTEPGQPGRPIVATRLWKYYHEDCSDTGTESLWCGEPGPSRKPWQTLQACERTKLHDPHEWVRRCTCWESNPALVSKRERERQYAEKQGKRVA